MVSRCSRATTAKKWTKMRDVRAKLLFCAFVPFSLPSPSSLHKLPKTDERAAPFLFSRRIALGTRMDLPYGLRSTWVVTRLLLLDMQRALYLWPNSSYTQDMEKGSVLEPGFCLGLCRWEIHTLILLNIKKGPETGRQPSFFNPVSMGYHWNKTWKGLSPRPCSGKREQTHVTGKGTNDTFGPASTQCKQAITRHVILQKMYRTTFSC